MTNYCWIPVEQSEQAFCALFRASLLQCKRKGTSLGLYWHSLLGFNAAATLRKCKNCFATFRGMGRKLAEHISSSCFFTCLTYPGRHRGSRNLLFLTWAFMEAWLWQTICLRRRHCSTMKTSNEAQSEGCFKSIVEIQPANKHTTQWS